MNFPKVPGKSAYDLFSQIESMKERKRPTGGK